MVQPEAGHHQHEPWKAKLADAFKALKEADGERERRLHHNEEIARRIVRDIFQPVLTQAIVDAKENGFNADLSSQPNGRYRLHIQCPNSAAIEFWADATPDAVTVFAKKPSDAFPIALPKANPSEPFQKADLTKYLIAELERMTPRKKQ